MPKNLKKIFGERVRSLRKEKALTQEELGQRVGVDYKHIGAIERGIRAPSFDVIERLAKVLKVEHYQLFLPADGGNIDTDAQIRTVMSGMAKAQRTSLQKVLHELLRVGKKMDLA